MENRFVIVDGSKSKHCCFEYTIVDIQENKTMCETFNKESAILICMALNAFKIEQNGV